jgi:hypothetical protein
MTILLFILLLFQDAGEFKVFNSLPGDWEYRSGSLYIFESWEEVNDSLLNGFSFTIKDDDTVSYERLRLHIKNGKIIYSAAVENQNDGREIDFELTSLNGKAVFENADHDFPQKITYEIKDDSLTAIVEGISNGKKKSFTINYLRK